jgi:hypothetical protein
MEAQGQGGPVTTWRLSSLGLGLGLGCSCSA